MSPHHAVAAPGSTASLRTANQQRVLDVLRAGPADGGAAGAFTQAELARATGLAPATVSNIVRQLVGAALVQNEPGSGRRGSAVRLARSAGLVAGVDFGHSHVAVAVGDLTGAILAEERRPLDTGHLHHKGLELARSMLDETATTLGAVRRIGLGLPAPITRGVVKASAILPDWEGLDAGAAAEEAFGTPVHVENDANLGALAEHRRGVARGHDTTVFVKISSGVGAGIIIDNQLFHGSTGSAGEIGHLTLDDQGPLCRCGSRGCLEAYTSVGTVQAMMADQLPGADFDDIVEAARTGNVSAQRTLEDAGLHLGWGLASIVNLINPAVVVIGGDMARAGDLLLESARIGLRRHALDSVAATPLLASTLGERASLVGALLLAAERTELVAPAG
ncbi:MAG: ROK family protein [Nocardioides sp.]